MAKQSSFPCQTSIPVLAFNTLRDILHSRTATHNRAADLRSQSALVYYYGTCKSIDEPWLAPFPKSSNLNRTFVPEYSGNDSITGTGEHPKVTLAGKRKSSTQIQVVAEEMSDGPRYVLE